MKKERVLNDVCKDIISLFDELTYFKDNIEKQAKKEELERIIEVIKKNNDWGGDEILGFLEGKLEMKKNLEK